MIEVTKEGTKYPFSKGILARSLSITGLTLDQIYEIVRDINKKIQEGEQNTISSKIIKRMVRRELLDRGYEEEEKFYRVSRKIRYLDKPLLVLIGGGAGVGKSTISSELGVRLGINRIVGSDSVREIMREMLPYEVIPALHESSFTTHKAVEASFVKNKLIYGFDQQVRLVSVGLKAIIERGIKEGLNTIINGVHLVPGYLDIESEKGSYAFQYVLDVSGQSEHEERFKMRAEGSHRDPDRYIENIDNIKKIQEYNIRQAEQNDARVLNNSDIESTIREIMTDIINKLEPVIENE
ncbi:MAG: ATP cone domain-containing protein [Candidatus Natronoplasma sp.]